MMNRENMQFNNPPRTPASIPSQKESLPVSLSEAVTRIKALELQTLQGGSVDSETESFEDIIQRLALGKINPSDALTEAENIISKRQDYH